MNDACGKCNKSRTTCDGIGRGSNHSILFCHKFILKVIAESVEGYPNGEITFNSDTQEYTVWDESYSDPVCVTRYLEIAKVALKTYGEYYL